MKQLQEKHLGKKKTLYFSFVDLGKAFDRVPQDVVWWAMCKLGNEEWLVRVVLVMYTNPRSPVIVNDNLVMNLWQRLVFTKDQYSVLYCGT